MAIFDTGLTDDGALSPANTQAVRFGATRIREVKQKLNDLLGQLFNDNETKKDGVITVGMLVDASITLAKLANLAQGSIILGDASNRPAALAAGSSGTVPYSNGTTIAYTSLATLVAALNVATPPTLITASSSPAATSTDITSSLTKTGEATLTLPAGRTWRWVKVVHVFSLDNDGRIDEFAVKIGATTQTWVNNHNGSAMQAGSGEQFFFTFIAEGVPTTTTSSITVDVYARTAGLPDNKTLRKIYAVGQYT